MTATDRDTRDSYVAALPQRTAHALHGLLTASRESSMPVTSAEAMLYDEQALTVQQTAAGLRHASKLGLVMFDGRYWWPRPAGHDLERQLEDRSAR